MIIRSCNHVHTLLQDLIPFPLCLKFYPDRLSGKRGLSPIGKRGLSPIVPIVLLLFYSRNAELISAR